MAVVFTDETTLLSESGLKKSGVGERQELQSQQLLLIERVLPCLGDRLSPAVHSGVRRAFAFDLKTRFGIFE